MKTILITGAAGFIGSHFADLILTDTDYEIVVLDSLTYAGKLENMESFIDSNRVNFIKSDICESKTVSSIFEKYDINYVINFAAESHVDNSINSPDVFIKTNIIGTHTLLNISKTYWEKDSNWTEKYKFVQVSTDEVYGMLGEDGFFTEETCLNPSSPYSASKASSDLLCMSYFKTYGYPVIITRSTNNFGPRQDKEKLIPKAIVNTILNRKIPIYGEGRNVRDWIFVKDNVKAIMSLLTQGKIGNTYNICGNNEMTNLEIVNSILSIINPMNNDLIQFVPDRKGHDFRYAVDDYKTRNLIGEYISSTFLNNLNITIRYYLDNQN